MVVTRLAWFDDIIIKFVVKKHDSVALLKQNSYVVCTIRHTPDTKRDFTRKPGTAVIQLERLCIENVLDTFHFL